MLYREIIAVCSHTHTKHINTLCGQNVEMLNVKPGGTYIYHWTSKRQLLRTLYHDVHTYPLEELEGKQPLGHREYCVRCSRLATSQSVAA